MVEQLAALLKRYVQEGRSTPGPTLKNDVEIVWDIIHHHIPPLRSFAERRIEQLVNAEIAADRPIEVGFLPRDTAVQDADLIRTKVSLIPESVREIRVVDIVGLDKQADGGTHVRSTSEVGRFRVLKTESKGKGNKRLRIAVEDA